MCYVTTLFPLSLWLGRSVGLSGCFFFSSSLRHDEEKRWIFRLRRGGFREKNSSVRNGKQERIGHLLDILERPLEGPPTPAPHSRFEETTVFSLMDIVRNPFAQL